MLSISIRIAIGSWPAAFPALHRGVARFDLEKADSTHRFRLPRLQSAGPRSWWQRRPLADTTRSGRQARRCQLRRSLHRPPYHPPAFPAPPSPSHSILQSLLRVCYPRLPAPSPAREPPWNPLEATTRPAGFESVAESAAEVS